MIVMCIHIRSSCLVTTLNQVTLKQYTFYFFYLLTALILFTRLTACFQALPGADLTKTDIAWYGRMVVKVNALDSVGNDELVPAIISVCPPIQILPCIYIHIFIQLNSVDGITKFAIGVNKAATVSFFNKNKWLILSLGYFDT